MPTVWMVSGNKGGVGKSIVSVGLTQTLINECGKDTVAVIDGDGRTPDVYRICLRKMPARALDFRRLRPDSPQNMTEDEYFDVIHNMLRASDHVVINTPDGADDQLMGWFDSTLQCTESMSGAEPIMFKFLFVLNTIEDGLEYLPALADRFQMLYPVRNLHFGEVDRFKTFNHNAAGAFRHVIDFPALGGFEFDRIKALKVLPQAYVDLRRSRQQPQPIAPTVLSRQRVQNWLCAAHEAFYHPIYDDLSNLKQGIVDE
ncbi:hypothetical protein ACFFU8_08875 [Chromobacterium piscinae]|uniref:hypothetical protein n=1 Tax=Chromobacterium piscinae TaxID=686831 RepID=UPI001E2AC28E|nr:hypothetical protein [Chromobacterium piscinae]MCD5327983.1 hypothetical protein [Chromobacterium piscinae]